jgi:hypothetical protein
LACAGVVAFCLVSFVVIPRICPDAFHFRARFTSGRLTVNATTPARRGLHYLSATGPFDRIRCEYLRVGSNVWFFEARTPIE